MLFESVNNGGGGQISLGSAPAVLVSNTTNTVTPYRQWTINTPELASTNPVLNVNVPITGGTDTGVEKMGTGTVEFSADNVGMQGNFFLNQGYVEIAANDALGSGGMDFGQLTGNTPVASDPERHHRRQPVARSDHVHAGQLDVHHRGQRRGERQLHQSEQPQLPRHAFARSDGPPAGQSGLQRPGGLRHGRRRAAQL